MLWKTKAFLFLNGLLLACCSLATGGMLTGCGGSTSRVNYPSTYALLTKLEGRLGTLRNMVPGQQRSFPGDLVLSDLVGVSSAELEARLGRPTNCDALDAGRRNRVCRFEPGDAWVYRFFKGTGVRQETYLVVQPISGRVRTADWRVIR